MGTLGTVPTFIKVPPTLSPDAESKAKASYYSLHLILGCVKYGVRKVRCSCTLLGLHGMIALNREAWANKRLFLARAGKLRLIDLILHIIWVNYLND